MIKLLLAALVVVGAAQATALPHDPVFAADDSSVDQLMVDQMMRSRASSLYASSQEADGRQLSMLLQGKFGDSRRRRTGYFGDSRRRAPPPTPKPCSKH